jgi:hypothetical protein
LNFPERNPADLPAVESFALPAKAQRINVLELAEIVLYAQDRAETDFTQMAAIYMRDGWGNA